MKTKSILCTLSAVVAALIVGGCSTNRAEETSAPAASPAPATRAVTNDQVRWVLETEVPADEAERRADLSKHMQDFAEKGWSVLSVTTHVRREDGSRFRRWQLATTVK